MFKSIWGVIKFAFFVVVFSLIFHQVTSRFFLSSLLRFQFGVPVEVGKAEIDFVNAEIRFEDVEIWNPSGFPPGVMIYIREMVLDSELSKLFSRHPVFTKIEMDIDNVRVIRLIDEPLNLFSMKIYKNAGDAASKPFFDVEDFILSVGKASFHDEASAGSGDVSSEIGLHRMTYHKVKNVKDILDILNWEILKKMHLESLAKGYLDQIQDDLEGPQKSQNFFPPKSGVWR